MGVRVCVIMCCIFVHKKLVCSSFVCVCVCVCVCEYSLNDGIWLLAGGHITTWKRRLFVLKGRTIYYFKNASVRAETRPLSIRSSSPSSPSFPISSPSACFFMHHVVSIPLSRIFIFSSRCGIIAILLLLPIDHLLHPHHNVFMVSRSFTALMSWLLMYPSQPLWTVLMGECVDCCRAKRRKDSSPWRRLERCELRRSPTVPGRLV